MELEIEDESIRFTENALQFQWQRYTSKYPDLQLLPGMHVSPEKAPGFATLTFEAVSGEGNIPTLKLKTAFVEALLSCHWGKFLQTNASVGTREESPEVVRGQSDSNTTNLSDLHAQVFGSSAGDLVFGYTVQWKAKESTWQESLLLNGVLEVKNLISWPKEMAITSEGNVTKLRLPPARDNNGQPTALNHIRHTIRILLNQHPIPSELLVVGQGKLLFQLARNQSWQFLAVVEHQLIDVGLGTELQLTLESDRRWTTVQEVRVTLPDTFRKFLLAVSNDIETTDPVEGIEELGDANYSYLAEELSAQLAAGNTPELSKLSASTLLVEASTPHWLKTQPVSEATSSGERQAISATTLQFLPNGTQMGILSNPQDYQPSDPQDPRWLLLTMPFLGRLQDQADDELARLGHEEQAASNSSTLSPLRVDPILCLATRTLPDISLALNLSSWGNEATVELAVSGFDTAVGRTWARLDPLSLEENWFRLQHPLREPQPNGLQSAIASLPDTPARLSRATALDRAFDAFRRSYPPTTEDGQQAIASSNANQQIVWRQNSLLGMQAVTSIRAINGLQVLYTFEEGTGTRIHDVSGVGTPLNLRVKNKDATSWVAGGLAINQPTRIESEGAANKIVNACRATNEITIEVWIKPAKVIQNSGARIVTLSSNNNQDRNFTLQQGLTGQRSDFYAIRVRTQTNKNGEPALSTPAGSVTTELSHVVYTCDAKGVAKLYINGVERSTRTANGNFSNWENGWRLNLGNEVDEERRAWLGEYYLVAIYDRALTPTEVTKNFNNQTFNQRVQKPLYSWHPVGLQILTSQLAKKEPNKTQLYVAATLLPALLKINGQANEMPLSFAVSPYLSIEFRPKATNKDYNLQLLSTELLCLESASGTLLPVASHFWDDLTDIEDRSLEWAGETHLRLCPESSVAILRLREINENPNPEPETEALLTTTYSYAIAKDIQVPLRLSKRLFRLRSSVEQLQFREGQFGGNQLPEDINLFELAPPQTTGVQPIYLTQPPVVEPPEPSEPPKVWQWGLSALRLSVQYTQDKQAAIGGLGNLDKNTLWWQAPQHFVQYRSALSSDAPTAGLPPKFRATAIQSLLPVVPAPALPEIALNPKEELNADATTLEHWQPVLPGAMRYLMIGDRAGAMFVVRNQLIRQSLTASKTQVLVSGSIPVQHRMPRPVPLPDYEEPGKVPGTALKTTDKNKALQTWASYFEPEQNLLATPFPADEAFFAECGNPPNQQPARRLQMKLKYPERATISQWKGDLVFELNTSEENNNQNAIDAWDIVLEVADAGQTFKYGNPTAEKSGFRFAPKDSETLKALQNYLATKAPGATLTVTAKVKPNATDDKFRQNLSFFLRVANETALPLPLEPYFIHFEDPEYNRQLASPAAHASGTVSILNSTSQEVVNHTVKLSCDRREYNPDSLLALRYDWDDNRQDTASLQLELISSTGAVTPLNIPFNSPPTQTLSLSSGQLEQLSLSEIQSVNQVVLPQGGTRQLKLVQGDTLQLKLIVEGVKPVEIFLRVKIVETPVIPATQAAYALLRQRGTTSSSVECVRFAWSPEPTRVELICPEDLRTEVVRRRAVFHWQDAVRHGIVRYAIQKITQTGSTHFPKLKESEITDPLSL